ncbi:zinc-ribbon domain-containing protein [Prevotella merdae]|uniref:zinc-ribbon domain-containing protein n=1 Tax=Prevotella merdae TaxID=2079531 RepID=UPI00356A5245
MKYCKHCNTKNIDEAKFCRKCGRKLEKKNVYYFILFLIATTIVSVYIFTYKTSNIVAEPPTQDSNYIAEDTSILDTTTNRTDSYDDISEEWDVDLGNITTNYRNESKNAGGASIVIWVDVINKKRMKNSAFYNVIVEFFDEDGTTPIYNSEGNRFKIHKKIKLKDDVTIPVCFYLNDDKVRFLMNNTYDLLGKYDVLLYDDAEKLISSDSSYKLNLRQFTSGPDDY